MYKKLTYILCISAMVCFSTVAQDKKVAKANTQFDDFAYPNAIDSYEYLVNKGMSSRDIYKKLGDSHFYNALYSEAAIWYEKLFALTAVDFDKDSYYRFALTLKSLGKYSESDLYMKKLGELDQKDNRAIRFQNNPSYREVIRTNSGRYTLKKIPINSDKSDYAPSIYLDQLVFSSARDTGIASKNIDERDGNPFNNLYSATTIGNEVQIQTSKFSPNLNTMTHEASAVFTKDGNTIYFTRNNSSNGKFTRDRDGISRLKIYKAVLRHGHWTDITELPFNSDSYSVAHPCLSADEKTLYFASDMPGTKGASDIFSVSINPNGSYGLPSNLGDEINTESRETFPFVSDDNILYFASDGHPGLGGLDVFATQLDIPNIKQVINLGEPINSPMDDFSFIIDINTKKGYFASNRKGGVGSDDIYSFTQNNPIPFSCSNPITGTIKDSKTMEVLASTELILKNEGGETITKCISSLNGTFEMEPNCSKEKHFITASKTGYIPNITAITVESTVKNINLEILLSAKEEKVKIGTDLSKKLNLEPIYFNLNSFEINDNAKISLNKIVAFLKQYPKTAIQIRSHTDARGDAEYNLMLSKKRARATMDYLIQQGILPSRLTSEGFGSTKPTNQCGFGAKCSEEEFLKNRRSEFILLE